MLRYFVAGNIWLFLSLVAFAGRTSTGYNSTTRTSYYGFLGMDRGLAAPEYAVLVCVPIAASAACFILYWKSNPAASFRFDIRTMLVVMAILALMLAIITAHLY
jgi:hypothetical protein